MKVYGVPFSPFVQRVLLAARLKGHELAVAPVPGGNLASPEFAALSPMKRIPLLEDGDLRICESAAIVAHLDETLDGPALLPADPAGRAKARSIAQLVDGEFAAGLRPYIIQKAFQGPSNPALLEAATRQIAQGLDAIERLIDAQGPWAAGADPSIADAALIPFLVLCEMLEGMPGIQPFVGERPKLGAYRARALASGEGARSRQEMVDGFGQIVARRRAENAAAQQQQ